MIISIVVLLLTIVLVVLRVRGLESEKYLDHKVVYSIEGLIEYVSVEMKHRCYSKKSDAENSHAMRQEARQEMLLQALKRCAYGSIPDKAYVKSAIKDILTKSSLDQKRLLSVIPFDQPLALTAMDCFDAILLKYQGKYGEEAFQHLVKEYALDKPRFNEHGETYYEIDKSMVREVFLKSHIVVDETMQMDLLVQRIYQLYKGFSVIDHLREMAIDGISGGVSGSVSDIMSSPVINEDFSDNRLNRENYHSSCRRDYGPSCPMNYESVWVFFEGKSIHLSFMSFGSESELKRVCQNIYRYNNVGMLSKDVGFKINDMVDGSRVVVVRPDFSESWAFFIRKFRISHIKLDSLLQGNGADVVIQLLKFLIKGGRITAVTGSQGSGKTTLLMALVGEVYPSLTIRIQETAFELQLRRIYPWRNILTFRETRSITGQQGLDLQKKTDGCVNILGEVATDEVAAWMIQMAQVASLFTLFTHHAKTASDLVLSLRNSLLKCDVFRDESVAEEQVISVLNFDIHLTKDYSGKRYIERITELVPCKEYSEMGKKQYEAIDIVKYDNGEYRLYTPISKHQSRAMIEMMTSKDAKAFTDFMLRWTGREEVERFERVRDCSGVG